MMQHSQQVSSDSAPDSLGLFSPVARIQGIIEKYAAIPLTQEDSSQVEITVQFEEKQGTLLILNPSFHRRKVNVLWQHEVMTALGLSGTLLERWMKPLCLRRKEGWKPLYFHPSEQHGGFNVIPCEFLHAGAVYDVDMEDQRTQVLANLQPEQRDAIRIKFQALDADGNGNISIPEWKATMGKRSEAMRMQIVQQYETFREENPDYSESDADQLLEQHLLQVDESERLLHSMFEEVDLNQDGKISFDEFCLAEHWWQGSTVDPTNLNLF